MYFSDAEINDIIAKNCGNPPQQKLLEYHIWLNSWKLEHYTKKPLLKGQAHVDSLSTYKRAIETAKKLLKQHYATAD